MTPPDLRDVPYLMSTSSAYKMGGDMMVKNRLALGGTELCGVLLMAGVKPQHKFIIIQLTSGFFYLSFEISSAVYIKKKKICFLQ